ncbi:MAG: SUF system NifU family Fe-S cluster assembly protein [Candidatus Aenigmarchaeota archaeon]|nr:SUF system NifU family Fe-S cluster assembly protein [Candidatus Aenigmarchaeota archaeon]
MDPMYREIILDYYRNPRNKGKAEHAEIGAKDVNTLCGDVIEITARVDNGKIAEIKFDGKGCAISQASASMLTELVEGKKIEEAAKMQKQELLDALGIELSASRIKCALLGFKVMKLGLYSYLGKKMTAEEEDEMEE